MTSHPPDNCPKVFIDLIEKIEKEISAGKEVSTCFYLGKKSDKNLLKIELDTLVASHERALRYLKMPVPGHDKLVQETLKAIPEIIKDQNADYIINIGTGWAAKIDEIEPGKSVTHSSNKKEVIIAKYEGYLEGSFVYFGEIRKMFTRKKIVKKQWSSGKVLGRLSHLLPLKSIK